MLIDIDYLFKIADPQMIDSLKVKCPGVPNRAPEAGGPTLMKRAMPTTNHYHVYCLEVYSLVPKRKLFIAPFVPIIIAAVLDLFNDAAFC